MPTDFQCFVKCCLCHERFQFELVEVAVAASASEDREGHPQKEATRRRRQTTKRDCKEDQNWQRWDPSPGTVNQGRLWRSWCLVSCQTRFKSYDLKVKKVKRAKKNQTTPSLKSMKLVSILFLNWAGLVRHSWTLILTLGRLLIDEEVLFGFDISRCLANQL